MSSKARASVRWPRRVARLVALAIALAAGTGLAFERERALELLRHPQLVLRQVDFVGLEHVAPRALWRRSQLVARTPLVDLDPDQIATRLAGHPRVASAHALRLWPSRLVVGVRERVPLAIDAASGLGLDATGARFRVAPDERSGLVRVRGDTARALRVIEACRRLGVEVSDVDATPPGGVRLTSRNWPQTLWLGSTSALEGLQRWLVLRSSGLLGRHRPREIDLRFAGHAVLRGVQTGGTANGS